MSKEVEVDKLVDAADDFIEIKFTPESKRLEEEVKVQKVPYRRIQKYAESYNNEVDEIGFYLPGFTAKKIDAMSDESWEEVIEKGREINVPSLKKFLSRTAEAAELIKGNVKEVRDANDLSQSDK